MLVLVLIVGGGGRGGGGACDIITNYHVPSPCLTYCISVYALVWWSHLIHIYIYVIGYTLSSSVSDSLRVCCSLTEACCVCFLVDSVLQGIRSYQDQFCICILYSIVVSSEISGT